VWLPGVLFVPPARVAPGVGAIPILLVSGFLGSGKTTLVRHLLGEARERGERVAVVSNELGELGIDAALLGEADASWVELEGGCICCKLSDAFLETLTRLVTEARPDRIVVETSGAALPYDTQLNFYREPVRDALGEDRVVVVVDAACLDRCLRGRRDPGPTFVQQVESADLLLLNKLDLVPASRAERLREALREIEPEAPIVGCVRAAVEPALLFPPEPGALRPRPPGARRPHLHEPMEATELALPEELPEGELRAHLAGLGALRVKGFARTREGLRLVQGVGDRIELEPVQTPPPPGLVGRLVVIRRAPA